MKVPVLLALCVLFFVLSSPVFAVSLSVTGLPSSIDKDQEFEADVLLSCSGCTSDSYLRGVFYPSGTSYFGFTQNNEGSWINAPGGSCTQYYKISPTDLIEGSWSGKLKVKPDISSSYYAGPAEYLFKIGRYTPSCSSPTWSQEMTIAITGPTPTPTPEPTVTSAPSNTPTTTVTPTKTPTVTPTKTNTPTPTLLEEAEASESAGDEPEEMILGSSVESSDSGKKLRVMASASALVAAGLALLSGVLVWQKRNALHDTLDK